MFLAGVPPILKSQSEQQLGGSTPPRQTLRFRPAAAAARPFATQEVPAVTASIPIGIVVVSDRASSGVYEDRSGPAIADYLGEVLTVPWHQEYRLIPDERPLIEECLVELADDKRCALIAVSGGTGPAPRDVTPEATAEVCDRLLPGFAEAMRTASLAEVPTAILSRQIAGTRGSSLIINLPGRPSAIRTCLDAVFAAVPYCIDLIGGPRLETDPARIVAFRPNK
jgi:molybdopterin adenylyltransferase